MTYLCVSIHVTDFAPARRDIARAAEAGADLVEVRLDRVEDQAIIGQILAGAPLPCIATCRPTWEGGSCELDEFDRIVRLAMAADSGASYVDIELNAIDGHENQFSEILQTVTEQGHPRLIISSHDFAGRPAKLFGILSRMESLPAHVNKLVWTARTIRDNLEAFEILQNRTKPTIAFCMGEAGIISRILTKKFGGFLTFASLQDGAGTAPGQINIADMKRLYRWDAIRPETRVYGVVGSPVAHSMSPAIHNAAFEATGFDGVYVPLLVNPGYESFKAFMASFLAFAPLDLSGLSVTIPHKENALRYLQEIGGTVDPLAERIGALNTIIIDRSQGQVRLRGFSTDYAAILDPITEALGIDPPALAGCRVGVIGAGGTGRTAVAALAHRGADVTVFNRTLDRAAALVREFNGRSGTVRAAPLDALDGADCRVYINTTSLGMHPKVDDSPFYGHCPRLGPNTLVLDAVYNPPQTKMLRQSQQAGAKTISGLEMFIRQAAGQFEAWTGQPAPLPVMRNVIETRLNIAAT